MAITKTWHGRKIVFSATKSGNIEDYPITLVIDGLEMGRFSGS